MNGAPGGALPLVEVGARRFKVKLVEVIRNPEAAKLISDPMRRAMLNLLRQKPLTEAQLADGLGLTDATVNYHLRLLKKTGFLKMVRQAVEEHGIVQKFYAPSAYLYLPDARSLPKEAARYYYPVNVERMRGVLSGPDAETLMEGLKGRGVDELGEQFAIALVDASLEYARVEVNQGEGERLVNRIYTKALESLRRAKSRP